MKCYDLGGNLAFNMIFETFSLVKPFFFFFNNFVNQHFEFVRLKFSDKSSLWDSSRSKEEEEEEEEDDDDNCTEKEEDLEQGLEEDPKKKLEDLENVGTNATWLSNIWVPHIKLNFQGLEILVC